MKVLHLDRSRFSTLCNATLDKTLHVIMLARFEREGIPKGYRLCQLCNLQYKLLQIQTQRKGYLHRFGKNL